jgi:hypothetical protein
MAFTRTLLKGLAGICVGCGQSPSLPPAAHSSAWRAPAPAAPAIHASEESRHSANADAGPTQSESGPVAEPCDRQWRQRLAMFSCDGAAIELRHEVAFNPMHRVPKEPGRSVLHAVGQLMREHPEVLLIRIEVSTRGASDDPDKQRQAAASTQRRADAIFRQLWRREKVSAERMEALGVGFSSGAAADRRFTTRIRVAQWR